MGKITGKTVGRVGIRAIPDLTEFRKDLKTGLDRIEQSYELVLKVSADLSKVRGEVLELRNEIAANAVDLKLDLDAAGALAHMDEVTRPRDVDVDVDADASEASARIDEATRPRDVDVDVNTAGAEAHLDALTKEPRQLTLRVNEDLDSSLRAAIAKIDAALARERETEIKVDLDEGSLLDARASIEEVLGSAGDIHLAVDESSRASVSAAIARIDVELSRLREVDLGVDLDEDSLLAAKARLESLKADIEVKADTAKANTEIARAARDRTATIHTRSDNAALESIGDALDDFKAKFGALSPQSRLLVSVLSAMSPAILQAAASAASLAASLGAAAGAAAAMVPALAGVAAVGVGTIIAGWKGVGSAVSAAGKQAAAGGGSVAKAARTAREAEIQLAQAQRALRNAQEGVPEAQRDLARSVERVGDAEKDLARAQKDAREAQEALNAAREKAVRNLRDMSNNLADAQLNERQAALDLADAQYEYARAQAFKKGPTELAKLKLALDKAQQGYKEATEATQDAAEAKADADSKGIDGSDAVTDAQERAVRAQEAVVSAQRALRDSVDDVAESQRRLRRATESVLQAQEALELQQMRQEESASGAAGGTDAFADAMAKLPPNAQAAVRALLRFKDSLSSVGKVISQNFFEGFADSLDRLGASVLPQLESGMAGVASAFGVIQNMSLDSLASSLGGGRLQRMLDLTAESVRNLGAGVPGVVSGVTALGLAGSEWLPKLGQWFGDLGVKFGEWAERVTSSGEFDEWIQRLVGSFHALGDAASAVGGIVSGLFKGMGSSGNGLQNMADVLQRVSDIVNAPKFQTAMTTIWSGAAEGMEGMKSALGSVGDIIAVLAPALSDLEVGIGQVAASLGTALEGIARDAAPGLQDFVDGLVSGIDAIAGSADSLGPLLGSLGSVFGELFEAAGPIVGELIEALAPALTTVLDVLEPLIPVLGDALLSVLKALAPILPIIANLIITLLPPLVSLISSLADLLVPVLEFLMPAIKVFGELVGDIVTGVIEVLQGTLDFLTGVFTGDWSKVWSGVSEFFSGIWNTIDAFFAGKLDDIVSWAKGLPERILSAVSGLVALASRIGGYVGQAKDAVVGKFNEIVSWVSGIPSRILGALGNLGSLLYNAGWNIITGLWNGLISRFNAVKSWVSGIGSWIANHKGPKAYDLGLLVPNGGWISEGLGAGLEKGFSVSVTPVVKSIAPRIVSAITDSQADVQRAMRDMVALPTNMMPSVDSLNAAAAGAGNFSGGVNYYDNSTLVNPLVEPESVTKRRKMQKIAAGVGVLG